MIDYIIIIGIALLIVISTDLIIKFEINLNKDLFYDLHKKEIEKELKKDLFKENI